jgi:DNA-binding NarL/FixJ family response regulator
VFRAESTPEGVAEGDPPAHRAVRAAVVRVLICHERPSTGQGLSDAVRRNASISDVEYCRDGFELADAFASKPADLVLVGYQRGRPGGAEATQLLLSLFPRAIVIAFGSTDASVALATAVSRGARGVLLWDVDGRPGSAGQSRTLPPVAGGPGEESLQQLTDRELQVLQEMSMGRSNAEIGKKLFLSEDTIKTHARKLFRKLGARDRAHAVALGLRHSLLT